MKFIDMFAGIGGFRTGMENAGHKCVGWIEIDKFARKSYDAIHDNKGVWNTDDITKVKATDLPKADCWTFGFPCQDISMAGKQKGFTSGKRSSLFFRVMGLTGELKEEDKPRYLFIENVKNLLSINKGLDFTKLLVEMDKRGYDAEWTVLDSAQVVPQHRERLFIIGHLRTKRTTKVFPIERKNSKNDWKHKIKYFFNARKNGKYASNNDILHANSVSKTLTSASGQEKVALPLSMSPYNKLMKWNYDQVIVKNGSKKGYDEAQIGDSINLAYKNDVNRGGRVGHGQTHTLTTSSSNMSVVQDKYVIRRLTPKECWRLQGFNDWQYDKAAKVVSNNQLYKQAGNAVTVPVIQLISEKMK